MSVIDIHVHAFPDKIAGAAINKLQGKSHTRPFTDGTVAGLAASMKEAGIDFSVLQPVATNPAKVIHVNDSAIGINERGAETGIFSFGCMHPDFEGWHDELSRVAAAGLKGIKLHPVYQGVDIDDIRYLRILSRAGELGLIVLIHAGWDVSFPGPENARANPKQILSAIRSAGPVTLILAHMGGWRCWEEAGELLNGTGAYIDTAFAIGYMTSNGDGHYKSREELAMLSDDSAVRIMRRFGVNRVLFGTDSPWSSQTDTLRSVQSLPLTEDEKAAILHGNAAGLLNISRRQCCGSILQQSSRRSIIPRSP